MKIALVVHECNKRGGHERYIAELAERLARNHEVHVFACSLNDVNAQNIVFHRIRAIPSPNLLKVFSFCLSGALQVRFRSYDIIHTQGLCIPFQDVATAHVCQAARSKLLSQYPLGKGIIRRFYHPLYFAATSALEKKIVYETPKTRKIIAISRKLKGELEELYDCSPERISVIYHGVDIETFHPQHRFTIRPSLRRTIGLEEQDIALLFVGTPAKGLKVLLQALAKINLANVKLMVVGVGISEEFLTLAQNLGIANRVILLGYQKEIHRIFACSDIFVHPTPYDAFGLVVLEAMASGLPAIVSKEAGASEIVTDGVDGLLLKNFSDVDEISAKIQLLVQNKPLRLSLGEQARKTAENYSWDKVAEETVKVYEEVLELKKSTTTRLCQK